MTRHGITRKTIKNLVSWKYKVPIYDGLPDIACPYRANGMDVLFKYAELDLCPCCEKILRHPETVTLEHYFVMATYNSQGHGIGHLEYTEQLLKSVMCYYDRNIGIAGKN